jgi:xanthine dehydrogenase small subunit
LCKTYAAHAKANVVAGGTDLVLTQTQNLRRFDTLIDVSETKELNEITISDDAIEIGAAVPIAKAFNVLSEEFSDFAELLSRFGSLPIRNQATLGGNLGNASPIADLPPALIALNAQIHLRSESNTRTMSIEHFYKGYRKTMLATGEIIEKIVIPRKHRNGIFRIYKITKRWEDDISAVCGAFYFCLDKEVVSEVRIAFGGMADIPKRALHLEEALQSRSLSMETLDAAAKALALDFTPIDDVRASKDYRMRVAQNLLKKCFLEVSQSLIAAANKPVNICPTRISHFA